MYPIASIGHTSCSTRATNATSPPVVRLPLPTASAPISRIAAIVTLGTRSRLAQNAPRRRAFATCVS